MTHCGEMASFQKAKAHKVISATNTQTGMHKHKHMANLFTHINTPSNSLLLFLQPSLGVSPEHASVNQLTTIPSSTSLGGNVSKGANTVTSKKKVTIKKKKEWKMDSQKKLQWHDFALSHKLGALLLFFPHTTCITIKVPILLGSETVNLVTDDLGICFLAGYT